MLLLALAATVVGRWYILLDDEEVALQGFAGLAWDLEWVKQLIRATDC